MALLKAPLTVEQPIKMVALAFMFTGRFVQQNVHIVILTPMYANLSIKKGGLQLFALN